MLHSELQMVGFDLVFNAWVGCFSDAPKLGVLELVQSNLPALVRTCLLYGGRSTAHKVARLLALCLEYVLCLMLAIHRPI